MAIGLPAKLKNFAAFVNGTSYAGQVEEMTLPKLVHKLIQWRGAGSLGEIDISMGLEKLETEMKFGGLVPAILGAFANTNNLIRFTGAYQDGSGVKAAELVMGGMFVEIDPGTAKAGEDTSWTVKPSLTYLKWSVSGRTIIEIDMLASVFVVNGVDVMAEIRAALQI